MTSVMKDMTPAESSIFFSDYRGDMISKKDQKNSNEEMRVPNK